MRILVMAAISAVLVGLTAMDSIGAQQARQIGGVGLTIFTDRDLTGRSATLRDDVPDLSSLRLDNAASSLQAGPGEQWEVCENRYYAGRCVVVSGTETDLRRSGWNDTISSARRVRGGGGIYPPVGSARGLELFSNTRFRGSRRNLLGAEENFQRSGFNDTARSLRVHGEAWEVCDDAYFDNCRVVSGDVPDLRQIGLSRRISSARPARLAGSGVGTLVLYDSRSYRGRSTRIAYPASVLSNFMNRAESVRVTGSWELCERPNFAGRCVVVSGDIPDLGSLGLRNRVNSARPAATPR